MSEDQRTTAKWMIRVDGSDLASVESGQTVEIGRKPLRPIAENEKTRVEILDDTRSMSKRHAEFSVKTDGNALLRDLNSTNGTFLVRPGNELVRLKGGSDFALTDDTVRLQFGDVPVDFVRYIDDNTAVKDDQDGVSNLFDYALDNTPVEPEAADLSVDDILNLRAGEPTNIFDAQRVRSRAQELHEAEQQTFVPFVQPLNPVNATSETTDDEDEDAAPRDLFADAHDVAAGKIDEPAVTKEEFVPHTGPRHADSRSADELVSVEKLSKPQHDVNAFPGIIPDVQYPQEPVAQEQAQAVPAEQATQLEQFEHDTQPMTQRTPEHQNFAQQNAALDFDVLATSLHVDSAQQQIQVEPANLEFEIHDRTEDATTVHSNQAVPEEHRRFQPPITENSESVEETSAFTPAFEPGSVFERVANGDFDKREEVIEAGGFTSDQARRSDDFSEQFEMARQPELLPFLAMNPSLYDDLYAWLAAQGNADIDHALQNNPGYEDYRKAVGK